MELCPIGFIRSPHRDLERTPIQPCFAEDIAGEVELDPVWAEGLEGLADFSHAWLIYHLHRAELGALTVKPYLGNDPKGIFACRYPHRPNALGLSLVRILRVEGARVAFLGADMLDGSPLLDLKPYFPQADRPEGAWGGWTEALDPAEVRRIGSRQLPEQG